MNKFDAIQKHLTESNIPFELIHHKPTHSVVEGLAEIGIEASQGFSSLLMNADGKFIMILRRDDNQVSFGKVKKQLKIKNLTFATKEEVFEITGCNIGYVSPYNPEIPTYIDEKILEKDYVYGGSGSPEHDLKLKPADLMKLSSATPLDIGKDLRRNIKF